MSVDFRALEDAFYGAMQRNDFASMEKMIDEECVYVHSFGARDDKASYLEKVKAGLIIYKKVNFTQDKIFHRGSVAVIIGTMTGVVNTNGLDRALNNARTSVWVESEHGWRLLAFQPTPLLDR